MLFCLLFAFCSSGRFSLDWLSLQKKFYFEQKVETGRKMMELRIQLIPTGEIILPPGKNGENYCHNCKVS